MSGDLFTTTTDKAEPDTLRQALAFLAYLLALVFTLCAPAIVAIAYRAAF